MSRGRVLNLVISGIPSILNIQNGLRRMKCFKPFYKRNTFNTKSVLKGGIMKSLGVVLNLVISGIPSIHSINSAVSFIME